MRKLIKALLTVTILIPTLGFAVGLGDIHLRSNLNQQLDAEIDLLSVEPSEVDKLTASLASYETFNKLGLDRPAVLTLLQFEVLKRPKGTPFIKIKSKETINEPFLDFLVEVSWPSGKVLREYTLLLDPPTMSARQEPLMVETPQVEATRATPQEALPVQEPVVSAPVDMTSAPIAEEPQAAQVAQEERAVQEQPSTPEQQAAQGQPSTPEQPEAQQAPLDQEAQAAQAPVEAPPVAQKPAAQPEKTTGRTPEAKQLVEPSAVSTGAASYGPVKRNETLYRIASKMRTDESVSVEQMMIALYNSNREAFMQNNINLLRKGAVLRIEDPAALRAMSQAEAKRQVARHGRAWEEYRSKIASRTPKGVPAEAAAAESVKAGTAAAPTKEESKLTLVVPSKPGESKQPSVGGTSEKGGNAESLRKELLLANEAAEAHRKENEELNKRLKELQIQVDETQKLLKLKDDNLAAMQQKLAEQQKEAAKGAAETTKPAQPAPVQPHPATPAQQPPLVEPAKPSDSAVKAPEVPPAAAGTGTTTAATGESGKPVTPADGAASTMAGTAAPETAKPAEPVKPKPKPPKKAKPVLPPPPPPEPTIVDQLLEIDPLILGGGVGAIILLLGLVHLLRKGRQGRGFQESILTVGATSSMMKGKGDNPASETSFLSDLAISGMGGRVQEESDVDPLTEADVYMAYNRFPQAEELLKEGLRHNPDRDELHAKLLEVYYKSKNRAAFEQHAQARAATMQRNQGLWQKVVAMGHEIAPDNPLFKGAAVSGGAALFAESSVGSSASNEIFDIGLDLDALSNEMEAAGAGGSDFVDLGLDFSDLGAEDSTKKKPDEPVTTAPSLDFDLNLGEAAEAPVEAAESPSFDFDLSSFGGDTASAPSMPAEAAQSEESTLGGLDFDLSSMAEESPTTEEPASALDFGDFDLGSVAVETPADEPESSFDLSSMDFGSSGADFSADTGTESIDLSDLDLGNSTEVPEMDLADLGDFGDLSDLGGGSLGGMDEVGTKLDLAKAYVDMGDADGARGMLEEVLTEGSDEQKRQAKELLAQIA